MANYPLGSNERYYAFEMQYIVKTILKEGEYESTTKNGLMLRQLVGKYELTIQEFYDYLEYELNDYKSIRLLEKATGVKYKRN